MNTATAGRKILDAVVILTLAFAVAGQRVVTEPTGLDQVSFNRGFAPVVKRVMPAVVNIVSSRIVRSSEEDLPPLFRGVERPRDWREQNLGSAVIVSPDGRLLTNHHMIEGAADIKVYLSDGSELKASVIGTDLHTDIAVLKIEASALPFLSLGDSSEVEIGEFAIAVGNPFGMGQTVTLGVISAVGRSNLGLEDGEDFIQTDAAVNPGSSGGALINVRGELIGINAAMLSEGTGNLGVGFAVPSNKARQVMNEILKNGRVIRGWLGVALQPMTPELAALFGVAAGGGALVTDVAPDGPAARAGLARGDVVLEFSGEPVLDSRAMTLKIYASRPNSIATLKIVRNGREQSISATLVEEPGEPAAATRNVADPQDGFPLGIAVEPLTPFMARQLGLPRGTAGVLVSDVQLMSPAEEAGLEPGDVIEEVNRERVASLNEFTRAITQSMGKAVLLTVNREGSHTFIAVQSRSKGRP
jgi:serine protease Do